MAPPFCCLKRFDFAFAQPEDALVNIHINDLYLGGIKTLFVVFSMAPILLITHKFRIEFSACMLAFSFLLSSSTTVVPHLRFCTAENV